MSLVGKRIRTKIEDEDLDEHDNRRVIPVGTIGTVRKLSPGDLYDIAWENGGWTRWTAKEIETDADIL